jgi:hypothetical protein
VSEAGVSEAQARVSDIEEMKARVREEEEEEANIYVLFFLSFFQVEEEEARQRVQQQEITQERLELQVLQSAVEEKEVY